MSGLASETRAGRMGLISSSAPEPFEGKAVSAWRAIPDQATKSDTHKAQGEARLMGLHLDNCFITNPFLFRHGIQRAAAAWLRPGRSRWGAGITGRAKDTVVHLSGFMVTVSVFMLLALIRRRGPDPSNFDGRVVEGFGRRRRIKLGTVRIGRSPCQERESL